MKTCTRYLAFWVVTAALGSARVAHASEASPAVSTLKNLQSALADDKKRGDWKGFLADARRQKSFLNGSPTSRLEVARAELQLGHQEAAFTEVRKFAAMGQTNDILSTPLFLPLKELIEAQLKSNRAASARATQALVVQDSGLVPEDLDYDTVAGRFYVTSILRQNIVMLNADGSQTTFAEAPDHWPMVALKVDSQRRRVWATEIAFKGFASVPVAEWGRSALLEFNLDSGALLSRYEGPPHSGLGDLTLASNGYPIVSDGDGGGIYRFNGHSLTRIDRGDFISPQTMAICPDDIHAYVPDYVRGIAAFDIKTGTVRWLASKGRFALDGIDGLYCNGRSLIAIQNGTSPARVMIFTLNSRHTAVLDESVIERSTATLGIPTHGVFVGHVFYYIANSGWDAMHADGTMPTEMPHSMFMRLDRS